MKRILFVAIIALAIASCDTPQTTTGSINSDSATIRSNTNMDTTSTNKPDSTKQ